MKEEDQFKRSPEPVLGQTADLVSALCCLSNRSIILLMPTCRAVMACMTHAARQQWILGCVTGYGRWEWRGLAGKWRVSWKEYLVCLHI